MPVTPKQTLKNLAGALLVALALAGAWWMATESREAMQAATYEVSAPAPDMDRTISVLP